MSNVERDVEICRLYRGGWSINRIAKEKGLSRPRVQQILRSNDVKRSDRPQPPRGDRDEFLGVNISEADKTALRQEAERRGLSMSALTAELIKEMLAEVRASSV